MKPAANVTALAGVGLILWAAWTVAAPLGALVTGVLLVAAAEAVDRGDR